MRAVLCALPQPGLPALIKKTGLTRETVIRALETLHDNELVAIESGVIFATELGVAVRGEGA